MEGGVGIGGGAVAGADEDADADADVDVAAAGAGVVEGAEGVSVVGMGVVGMRMGTVEIAAAGAAAAAETGGAGEVVVARRLCGGGNKGARGGADSRECGAEGCLRVVRGGSWAGRDCRGAETLVGVGGEMVEVGMMGGVVEFVNRRDVAGAVTGTEREGAEEKKGAVFGRGAVVMVLVWVVGGELGANGRERRDCVCRRALLGLGMRCGVLLNCLDGVVVIVGGGGGGGWGGGDGRRL